MRTRIAVAAAALVAAALMSHYIVGWLQVTDVQLRGTDFSASYVAALLVRAGHGAQLYDQALEQHRHLALLPAGTRITLPFITPPTAALLALPFTLLDLAAASRMFAVVQVLALVGAVLVALRAAPWPDRTPVAARIAVAALAVVALPTFVLLLMAQLDGLCALGLATGYACWRAGRRGWAGFAIALPFLALKPHLVLGLAVFLVFRREWRVLAGSLVAGILLAVASLAVVGVGGLAQFATTLLDSLSATPPASTVGTAGLVASWLGTGPGAVVLSAGLAALALGGCAALGVRSRRRPASLEPALLGATALSLVLSPHLLPYDLVVLAPLFAACMACAAASDAGTAWPGPLSGWAIAGWLLTNVAINEDIGAAAPAPPGRLTPYALTLAALVGWQATKSARARRLHAPAFGWRALQPGSGSGVGGSVE